MHHLPTLRHAAASDPGRLRLANEDAAACDPRLGLFVVCDGIGGRPSGEAASQIVAHTLAHALRRRVRHATALGPGVIKNFLASSVIQMNDELYRCSRDVPALEGMGCTIVAGLFDTRMLFFVYAGDSRAYLLRQGVLRQLSRDHSQHDSVTQPDPAGGLIDPGERRLLTRYVGMPLPVVPTVGTVKLSPGDRVVLCSDGLTDPLPELAMEQVLLEYDSPYQAADALIDAANAAGGPDNITAVVIDYDGPREVTDRDRVPPPHTAPEPAGGVAAETLEALAALEDDLKWLQHGAAESSHPSRMTALAAAKKRLGRETYLNFLGREPDRAPVHVFHQACTDPDAPWRRTYQRHLDTLEQPLSRIMHGGIRLSPVLTGDETARIYSDLWRGWRKVEQRYFATCQREAVHASEATLDILIAHMLSSVQTLAGLLHFLPRFMR